MTRDDPADRPYQVAVIGIGCRLPGDVDTPDALWELLLKGGQTAGEIPARRWRAYRERGPEYEAVLRDTVTAGSYLRDVAGFDAEFFGLSPREAAEMDPQQRILLEVGWEALEHAGVPPTGLAGTDTGVFVGVSTTDYGDRLMEDLPTVEAYTGIGAATCALANRVSYALDLRGPSVAVDTACSASLVAVHLACQSLLLRESTVALAGGVNLVLSPGQNASLQAAGTLAPDGVSKSFDRDADGYGRGEGCGVLVLKRLDDAERDGDRILAVIRGSAVNQDGHTDGIMAPSGPAQQHVVRRACERAGVAPTSVDYVEAHGTGTQLGDPVEATALAAVYGPGRPDDRPCLIGSIKSNVGHLEGAAGVAGLMKAILALHRGQIPGTPLRGRAIDAVADGTGLRLVTGTLSWPRRDGPRRAAVSGFGYGGTIAHVVLEEAPAPTGAGAPATDDDARPLFPLSARSDAALRQQAARLADRLAGDDPPELADVGHTLAHRRAHLTHRAVVTGQDHDEVVAALRRLATGQPDPATVSGVAPAGRPAHPVWVFSGHGSHWAGMGRDLLAHEPAFAAAIDEIEPVVAEEAGFSLRQALADAELAGVDRIQTLTFAMHVGLAALWRSYGVRPAAVIGHSVGEVAAAVTAGVLTPADGARLICRRSALLRRAAGRGAMAMVTLPFAEVAERLAGRTDLVAAIASAPASTVVSGDIAAVDAVIEQWPADRIAVRRVQSDVAFHSPHMDALTDELRAAAADLRVAAPTVPMYSTVLDDPRAAAGCDGEYWAANLRRPVRLVDAVGAALADGHRAFVEISAHPVVAHSLRETLDHAGIEDGHVGTTLRRHAPGHRAALAAVAEAHCHGVGVDWARLRPAGGLTDLPRYAWRHQELWREPTAPVAAGGHDIGSHTLLGAATTVAGSELRLWHTVLSDASRPYPGSHTVQGAELVPAAVLAATFLAAGARDGAQVALHDLSMRVPLATAGRQEIQVVDDGGRLLLASRPAGTADAPWLTHATARVAPDGPDAPPARTPSARGPGGVVADPGLVRDRLARVGVPDTGFPWTVDRLTTGNGGLRARVRFPEPAGDWAAVIDAAVSIAPAAFPGEPRLRLVDGIERIRTTGAAPTVALVDVVRDDAREDTVDVTVSAPDGTVAARLTGLRYPVVPDAPAADTDGAGPARQSLADLDPEELRARLVEEVRAVVAAEMKLAVESLDPRLPLVQQGMDSVMTVIVRRRLEKTYRQVLPASLFWQQPTVTAIAVHLAELIAAPSTDEAVADAVAR
ncbi:Acyl transferase domain-containing protein [Micromonospora citrea]|uniref:Acyl transferase domain-containing protein n=1 Tax=Micromonospora citrea TaxID=47855 RepID=A0A1C6VYM6_9ACTN|nr:type I polyketide synthase [Micromonospora citrea]SCL71332.1 Acyl transferase domain-containing protein [Micromonospora citrea]